MRHVLLLAWSFACTGEATAADVLPTPDLPDAFWAHWGDGAAEVAAYRLKIPRYGEIREGRTTLVTVTETFTRASRVKSDGGHDDEYPVLKVNRVDDFQTGIYDYNVMTSTFVRIDGAARFGEPVKVSMSMQEWCGHVYEQLMPVEGMLRWTSHSYFDGEADRDRDLGRHPNGIVLDALPILVRGLTGPLVAPGESITVDALPTLVSGRYTHRAPSWGRVTVSRRAGPLVTVPAGEFATEVILTEVEGGVSTAWFVEGAWPHRLVRWETSDGEIGELLGVQRTAYWQQNRQGDQQHLVPLGTPAPASLWTP